MVRYKKLGSFLVTICLMSTVVMLFLAKYANVTIFDGRLDDNREIVQDDDKFVFGMENSVHPPEFVENLPKIYFSTENNAKKPSGVNKSCATYPDLFRVKFRNDHWQSQTTSNGTFQLLNAFFDDRPLNPKNRSVRILGMFDRFEPNVTSFCQLWFENQSQPLIVQTREYYYIWVKGWGGAKFGWYQPYLISCDLPENLTNIPTSVSLVEKPCENATNNLRLIYDKVDDNSRKDFVVCVKGLDFPYEDLSLRLLEWIELLRSLGADKVVFYEFSVHPNIRKLLDYYTDQGFVQVFPLTIVEEVSNHPNLQQLYLKKQTAKRRLQEVIPYNDCFYRNMNSYKYVVILDTDEVIVPANGRWKELIDPMEKEFGQNYSSYDARNIYFLDSHLHAHDWFKDVPRYMHMMQHVFRAAEYTKPGFYVKCFHRTAMVHSVHNHYPRSCLTSCRHKEIDLKLGHLQHYRSDCVKGVGNCDEFKAESVLDTRVWNFKNEVIERCSQTLRDLNYFL